MWVFELVFRVNDYVPIPVTSHPCANGASRISPKSPSDIFGDFRSQKYTHMTIILPRGCEKKPFVPSVVRHEGPSVESPSRSHGGIDVKPR